jgi:hypothetical protein
VFRNEITETQRDASINTLQADLMAGLLQAVEPIQSNVLLETERLSAMYSEKLGTRSLDILHVAMAITLGSKRFLSQRGRFRDQRSRMKGILLDENLPAELRLPTALPISNVCGRIATPQA